jgi:hypothetical protein
MMNAATRVYKPNSSARLPNVSIRLARPGASVNQLKFAGAAPRSR